MIKELLENINKKISAIHRLVGFTNLVTWESMVAIDWNVDEVLMIGETTNVKLSETDYHIRIRTTMPSGSSFTPSHYHDFVEFCTVIAGEMYEPLIDRRVGLGGRICYGVAEPHEVTNDKPETTVLIVDWIRTDDSKEAIEYLDKIILPKT